MTVEQFSYFYYEVKLRNQRVRKSQEVTELAAQLIALHRTPGLRGWWVRATRAGRLSRELTLYAISYEFDFARQQREVKQYVEDLYERSTVKVLRPWLEAEIDDDDSSADLKTSRETAELLEPRRLREANMLLVIVVAALSAFLGAAAKALIG
ncbi:hypothetical protein JD77_02272 [Micromonospora olivasterospora]|uniref:Uncharacterized protein n=2 Tax=Micromonospora olivasterospora TaxID=1880 RepID=A0A562I945_MICOL|nr:hypothetical protein JD77_02272 [Micromonospora olivasterospora]